MIILFMRFIQQNTSSKNIVSTNFYYTIRTRDSERKNFLAALYPHVLRIRILAVLKTGAAYVPMDPNYPEDRIKYIVEDTKTKIILTNEGHTGKLQQITAVKLLAVDNFKIQELLQNQAIENLNTATTSNNKV